jgi:hypothetical protein
MRLVIHLSCLKEAREFFEAAGSYGREGTGLLIGSLRNDVVVARRFIAPDQVTGRDGGWVEVTMQGKLYVAANLHSDEVIVARIHSHPSRAFHSAVDDSNPVLTAEGAWSIVVPYFGLGLRRGLETCAIYQRRLGRWQELTANEIMQDVSVINDN